MAFLGMMLVTGRDVEPDPERGLEMLRSCADQGQPESQFYLGKLYYDGKHVARNIPLAKRYLQAAFRNGDPDAGALLETIRAEKARR